MSTGSVLGIYVFGSVGRGQQDDMSDLDVLTVVRNGSGRVAESTVAEFVPLELRRLKLSISWYGCDRLRTMFNNGELFAWHLHRETLPLHDPISFLSRLGTPAMYRDAVADTRSFQKVLRGIPAQVAANEYNAIYEAGLCYVCLRNIAMAASWLLCEYPDFTRYSPFKLEGIRRCPISESEFHLTMACRMASQRGNAPPLGLGPTFVLDLFQKLEPWVEELCSIVQGETKK